MASTSGRGQQRPIEEEADEERDCDDEVYGEVDDDGDEAHGAWMSVGDVGSGADGGGQGTRWLAAPGSDIARIDRL